MRYYEIISEAPVADIAHAGGLKPENARINGFDRGSNFNQADVKLWQSPKGIKKIQHAFSRTKNDFNLYVIFPTGRLPKMHELVTSVTKDQLEKMLGQPVDTNGKITCVYFNNITGSYRRPMNAWTLAHRLGHALQFRFEGKGFENSVMNQIARLLTALHDRKGHEYRAGSQMSFGTRFWCSICGDYERDVKEILLPVLSMRSARENEFNSVELELFPELMAQHLITGRVRFNRVEGHEAIIEDVKNRVNELLAEMFDSLVGQIVCF